VEVEGETVFGEIEKDKREEDVYKRHNIIVIPL